MRKIFSIVGFSTMFTTLLSAASWSGVLLDSSCFNREYQQSKDMQKAVAACGATAQTTAFELYASGKNYKLDSGGNTKAAAALKNRADRIIPGSGASKSIQATVEGTESSDTIRVDKIEVQ